MPKKTKLTEPRVPSLIHDVSNGAETRSISWMQVVSRLAWRTLGCVQTEIRAHLGGREVNQGNGRGGERCEASQLECNGEPVCNPTSDVGHGKIESTSSSGKLSISD